MRAVWIIGDCVHLAHVSLVGDGSYIHFHAPLSCSVRLGYRVALVHVRAAIRDDNGDVLRAVTVSTARREDAIVGFVDRLLRVGATTGGAEAERVQDLPLVLVLVQVELDPGRVGETDERDANASHLERQTVDDLIDEADTNVVNGVDAAGEVQDEGHVHLLRATCQE